MNNERKKPPKHKFGVFHKECSRVLPLQGMTNGAKQMSRAPVTVDCLMLTGVNVYPKFTPGSIKL